jgi:hypothetical protein
MRNSAIIALGVAALLVAGCGASSTSTSISAPAGSTSAAGTADASPAATHHGGHPGPAATVRAYFKAINRHDYRRAWRLGGRYTGGSYAAFASGFAGTEHDAVTILSVAGHVVRARLAARQTEGSVKTYKGTYQVNHGVITGFRVAQVFLAPVADGLLTVHDPGEVTGSLSGPCHARHHGELADPSCTPGSVDPAVTQADIGSTICQSGYTETVRPPESQTGQFKWNVAEPAYGQSNVRGELDHLVPLELGGSNDATNLWVEAGPLPNPKDAVEDALNREVCDGTLSLRAAQREIARNWLAVAQQLGQPTGSGPAQAPAAQAPAASTGPGTGGGCHPTASTGNCYEPGEFCPHADAGMTGVAGDGKAITCEQINGYYRWED